MNNLQNQKRIAERGGAAVKLLLIAVVLILIANAGYNFIPTAYQGANFKQEMETAIVQGVSLPSSYGTPTEVVREKLQTAARVNEIPYDVLIDVKQNKNIVTARVYYAKKVPILPFGVYEYDYVFDHTATPGGFLAQ
ncbi:MAG: hypothetical protein OEM82_13550 [Acidobacteriota bacterium]|nr:hypothetical protein [Acidobacteriota bacterium]MDH3528186.1 hypothetical protein [Acidobacteriota bacterium]